MRNNRFGAITGVTHINHYHEYSKHENNNRKFIDYKKVITVVGSAVATYSLYQYLGKYLFLRLIHLTLKSHTIFITKKTLDNSGIVLSIAKEVKCFVFS